MSGFVTFSKVILVVVNVLLCLLGLGLLGGGAAIYVLGSQIGLPIQIAIGVMVCGGVIAIVACLGCFGALFRVTWMLVIYLILVVLIIGGEVAFVVISYTNAAIFDSAIVTAWSSLGSATQVTIQTNFNCCGLMNVTDQPAPGCNPGVTTGCYPALVNELADYTTYVQVAGFVLMAVQVLIACFTTVLLCSDSFSDEDERKRQLEDARQMNRDVNDYANAV